MFKAKKYHSYKDLPSKKQKEFLEFAFNLIKAIVNNDKDTIKQYQKRFPQLEIHEDILENTKLIIPDKETIHEKLIAKEAIYINQNKTQYVMFGSPSIQEDFIKDFRFNHGQWIYTAETYQKIIQTILNKDWSNKIFLLIDPKGTVSDVEEGFATVCEDHEPYWDTFSVPSIQEIEEELYKSGNSFLFYLEGSEYYMAIDFGLNYKGEIDYFTVE